MPGIGPGKPADIHNGIEYEEIEAGRLESRKTLQLAQFVPLHNIPVLYYEKPHYVVPADDLAEEAFIVLSEAAASNFRGIDDEKPDEELLKSFRSIAKAMSPIARSPNTGSILKPAATAIWCWSATIRQRLLPSMFRSPMRPTRWLPRVVEPVAVDAARRAAHPLPQPNHDVDSNP